MSVLTNLYKSTFVAVLAIALVAGDAAAQPANSAPSANPFDNILNMLNPFAPKNQQTQTNEQQQEEEKSEEEKENEENEQQNQQQQQQQQQDNQLPSGQQQQSQLPMSGSQMGMPSVQGMGAPAITGDVESTVGYTQNYLKRKFPGFFGNYHDAQKYAPVNDIGQRQEGSGASKMQLPEPKQYAEKSTGGSSPTRVGATGYIRPDGQYVWDGRVGQVPNPTLAMPGFTEPHNVKDAGALGLLGPILDSVDPTHGTRTTSITNFEFAALAAAQSQMLNELRAAPERWTQSMKAAMEAKQATQSNNQAKMAEANSDASWEDITSVPLVNIANENAWQQTDSRAPFKKYEQVAWMVGKMYKEVYIPMAILFLLPGAILTQVKIVVRTGFLFGGNDEDLVSPWSGVMRSIIAIFLIPATQLFMSYMIDVGNSLTYEVTNFKPWYDLQRIKDWRDEQSYDSKPENYRNHLKNIQQHQGKAYGTPEKQVRHEDQSYMSTTGQQWYNTMASLLSQGMLCLNAFQFVIMLYLFLLGPIAAALFAWPGVARETFRKVFANWMNGVVLCSLWKFWWSVILLIMSVRLYMYNGGGQLPPPEDPFEMFMCAAFSAMLMYIPFNPFDFRPGDLVSQVLDKAQAQTSKGGSGAAAAGSAGGAGGSGGSGAGQNTGTTTGSK